MSQSDMTQKTSTIGRLSMKTKPFGSWQLLGFTTSCVQNGKKWLTNSSFLLCVPIKKKNSLRNSPINNFLWHSEKFILCCIRQSWLKNTLKNIKWFITEFAAFHIHSKINIFIYLKIRNRQMSGLIIRQQILCSLT